MSLRPLGIAKEIVEEIGHEAIYAYDDLLFVAHNAFLVQFDDTRVSNLKVFFNAECDPAEVERLKGTLARAAEARKFSVTPSGRFELVAEEGASEFQVRYLP